MNKNIKIIKRIVAFFITIFLIAGSLIMNSQTAHAATFSISTGQYQLYESGCLKSMEITITPNGYYATAYGKIGVHSKATQYTWSNRLTYDGSSWDNFDENYMAENDGWLAWANGGEFCWTAGTYTATILFDDNVIDLSAQKSYYIYLWTRASSYGIYTDATLVTFNTNDGTLTDSAGGTISIPDETSTEPNVPTKPVETISLNKAEQTIHTDNFFELTATVSPDDATDKTVKWSVSNEKVKLYSDSACTIPVGTVATSTLTVYAKGIMAGDVTVTVTSNSDDTKIAICNVTVKRFEPTVGISPDGAGTVRLKYEDEDYINGALFLDPIANAGYEFDYWSYNSGDTSNSSSLTYTNQTNIVAHFKPASYTVTFRNYDGTVLKKVENVAYNSSVTPPDNPTRTGYTFDGWDREFTNITSNLTVTATYTVNTYTVTWVNYDGSVLKEESVDYGVTPTYTGETPTKPADAQYTYTFLNWTPVVMPITDNVIYIATFKETEIPSNKGETEITTNVKKDDKSPELSAVNLTDEFAESTLSNEEKTDIEAAIEQGKNVDVEVYIEISDINDSVDTDDKEKITALVADADNIEYFDISLFKEISIAGQSQGVTSLHELTTPLKLTIVVPKNFPAVADGYTRTYEVIRLHDGVAEKLSTTVNADGTITFETDKFSTYALAYTDTKKEEVKEPTTETPTTETPTTTVDAPTTKVDTPTQTIDTPSTSADTPKAPTTGDKINLAAVIMLMIDSAMGVVYFTLRRRMTK